MKEYFKNENEKEKETLKEIITSSTETNTERTVDYFHNMAVIITSVIDEIETHFGPLKSENYKSKYSLEELNADLKRTMLI
jgi:hypothetical protein